VTTLAVRIGRPRVSFRLPVRAAGTTVLLAIVVAGLAAAALAVGRSTILDPAQLVDALFGSADSSAAFAVREVRLPRILAGTLIGFALGLSGAIFQLVARNGLVSPDIVGVNAGASFAALVVIVLGTQAQGQGDSIEVPFSLIGPAALVGAFGAAIAVLMLGYRSGLSPYRVVLVGIGMTAVLGSGIAYLLTLTRFPFATQLAFRWTVGSMYGVDWTEVGPALIVFVVLAAVTLFVLRPLNALALGDDTAAGLGAHVERDRFVLWGVGVCFAALAVALAGPVGFVAFVAPHIVRGLIGPAGLWVPIAAGLAGAAIILLSDFAALHALPGDELPLGAMTALIGAPYFLFLLYRTNRLGGGG
jgi:iron complex transport system permease protein